MVEKVPDLVQKEKSRTESIRAHGDSQDNVGAFCPFVGRFIVNCWIQGNNDPRQYSITVYSIDSRKRPAHVFAKRAWRQNERAADRDIGVPRTPQWIVHGTVG